MAEENKCVNRAYRQVFCVGELLFARIVATVILTVKSKLSFQRKKLVYLVLNHPRDSSKRVPPVKEVPHFPTLCL
jgi:hypothetical protein